MFAFSNNNTIELKSCLACGSSNLKLTLDLGKQPLANSYKKTKDEIQEEYPLAINRCCDCYHVQLTHAVNPDLMFKNYSYVSGTSLTMRDHFEWFARYVYETFFVLNGRKPMEVFDIGCNDGSQLDQFINLGVKTFGVDPATNLHERSADKHTVWNDFFGKEFANQRVGLFDIVIAQNVFAHNYSPVDFCVALSSIMSDCSIAFIQTSQADMIKNNEFDTIYHEHISFYNINSFNKLCNRTGLHLFDVIKCPLHGNSYIFVVVKSIKKSRPEHIENLIAMERKAGLLTEQTYLNYATKCNEVVKDLKNTVDNYARLDLAFHTVGYGAAAKGMTLLNYSKIPLEYIIDDNPLKQGKFTPGSNVPIVSADILKELNDACLFVPLAWNFFDEIKTKIKSKRTNQYDLFCTYFPNVEVRP